MNLLAAAVTLFARPWLLPLAIASGALILWIGWRTDARRRARLAQLGDLPVLERLVPTHPHVIPPRLRAALLGVATACIGIALCGPRWGERNEQRRDVGVDVALVLDVSASMLATDEGASRLERMKGDVRRLLATMPAARLALLVVAGRGYLLTPLTADHDALELFLDGLDPGMVSQGGTALAEGITQATQLLGASGGNGDRAIVVMSDGETWDGEAEVLAAAKAAHDAHIVLVTVGYGTTAGATIPLGSSIKRDADGKPVITRAVPATLQAIATQAEGVFVDGVAADRPGRVRAALRRLRQTERTYNAGSAPIQRYALFLWPGFVLLLIDALLGDRTRRARPLLAVLGLCLVGVPQRAGAQSSAANDEALALFRARRYVESVRALQAQMASGDRSVRTMYNLGTALLAADSVPAATEMLERVVTIAPDADLRFRALFNLGLANLRRARGSPQAAAGSYYAAAVAAYKRALRTRTNDPDAKWNLELAIREQERQGGGGGGGGGGQQPPPTPPPPTQGQQDLDKQRAAAVLNSAARDERDVQAKRQRDGRSPREASGARDW